MKLKLTMNKDLLFFCVVSFLMIAIISFGINSPLWQNDFESDDSTMFLPGRVVEVVEDRTNINEAGARVGSQVLRIELLSGDRESDIITAQNLLFPIEHGVFAQEGERVLVFFQQGADGAPDNYFSHIQSYDRTNGIVILIIGFFGLLLLIFGKSGLKATFGLVFTFVVILFLLLPLISIGLPPGVLTIGISILIVVVSIISIMGFTKKTYVSILGSCFGILCYVLFYFLSARLLNINGFNIEQVDLLIVAGFYIGVRDLLFSSILIASLGGIMDVAVSLASATFEISEAQKQLKVKELFNSGMKIGKDMIGSSSNTLILAFTGTFLINLLLFATTNTNYHVLINRADIVIEILRAISASSAMVLCAPITAFISASTFAKK